MNQPQGIPLQLPSIQYDPLPEGYPLIMEVPLMGQPAAYNFTTSDSSPINYMVILLPLQPGFQVLFPDQVIYEPDLNRLTCTLQVVGALEPGGQRRLAMMRYGIEPPYIVKAPIAYVVVVNTSIGGDVDQVLGKVVMDSNMQPSYPSVPA